MTTTNLTSPKKIIQVLGPTGVGKSSISVKLALTFNGEIISADSMQVYKDFNIGTDKIMPGAMQGVPHHLIDIFDSCDQFNASIFLEKSYQTAESIINRGNIPIVCGGTALYLKTMISGIFPESNEKRISRDLLNRIADNSGLDVMWERLNRVDPEYGAKVSKKDKVRIVRALEIYYNNRKPPTEIFKETRTPFSPYTFIRIGLNMDRDILYRRIESRVDRMVESGLLDEVIALRKLYPAHCPPFQSLGYKEMAMHLDDDLPFDEAVSLIKQHSRNFAKRQLSWFRRETDICWFDPSQYQAIVDHVTERLQEIQDNNNIINTVLQKNEE